MALIQASEVSAKQLYHIMVQTIIPRPIAWVLTQNQDDSLNLAPFSYFNGICSDPPLIMISIGKKSEADKKDTWTNIERTNNFVVNLPSVSDQEAVSASAEPLAYGDSEIEKLQLQASAIENWPLPRLNTVKAAFWCTRYDIFEVGNKPQALILGEIQSIWLDDAVTQQEDKHTLIDAAGIDPLARLGKDEYGSIQIINP